MLTRELEARLANFLGKEACLLFSTGYQTAQGIIPTLVQRGEFVVSDKDNHACIVAGNLMAKGAFAQFDRYKHNDMDDLERQLKAATACRYRLIATDGVFSMDGIIADLKGICDLADRYDALVMVDDEALVAWFLGALRSGAIPIPLSTMLTGATLGAIVADADVFRW